MDVWLQVQELLGTKPIITADIAGETPLHVERYFFQSRSELLPGLPTLLLATHLGGAPVSGGHLYGKAANMLPSFSLLLPAECPTEWFFEGPIDCVVFYFSDMTCPRVSNLLRLTGTIPTAHPFTDPLISAAAQQIADELGYREQADHAFLGKLSAVMVEQIERVLAGRAGQRISPDRLQLGRLKAVIHWINEHLSEQITNDMLARQAGISDSHFRQMFVAAMGTSPIRYVQRQRIEQARELLGKTNFSIAKISSDCGFVSQSYLTTCFRTTYGMTPGRYRRAMAAR